MCNRRERERETWLSDRRIHSIIRQMAQIRPMGSIYSHKGRIFPAMIVYVRAKYVNYSGLAWFHNRRTCSHKVWRKGKWVNCDWHATRIGSRIHKHQTVAWCCFTVLSSSCRLSGFILKMLHVEMSITISNGANQILQGVGCYYIILCLLSGCDLANALWACIVSL